MHVAAGEGAIERDANGRQLPSARERWLDGQGVLEPGTRDAYCTLWDAMQRERDAVFDERISGDEAWGGAAG